MICWGDVNSVTPFVLLFWATNCNFFYTKTKMHIDF